VFGSKSFTLINPKHANVGNTKNANFINFKKFLIGGIFAYVKDLILSI